MSAKKKSEFSSHNANAEEAYESASESEKEIHQSQPTSDVVSNDSSGISQGDSEIEVLRNELEKVKTQAKENLEGWQRSQAEFMNYKKRIERDQEIQRQASIGNAVKRYLPVVDDLERALANIPDDCKSSKWVDGINLINQKMKMAFEADGVKPMGNTGEPFDPNLHEAISQEPSDQYQSGQIVDVLQKGYVIGDRVLRPAIVRVAQ
jgi:molecular chaperone GrpE